MAADFGIHIIHNKGWSLIRKKITRFVTKLFDNLGRLEVHTLKYLDMLE